MDAFDFSELTDNQQALITQGGWRTGGMGKIPRPGTVRKLLQRGLVIQRTRRVFGVDVREYDVPEEVSAAWHARTAETTAR